MLDDSRCDITRLLKMTSSGNQEAQHKLIDLIYESLHTIARYRKFGRHEGHTWSTTDLVHEVIIQLKFGEALKDPPNRKYFFGAVNRTILQLLVKHARERKVQAHGHIEVGWQDFLDVMSHKVENAGLDTCVLEGLLNELEAVSPRQLHALLLRFFLELPIKEIAVILDISPKTVELDIRMAKAWLKGKLEKV